MANSRLGVLSPRDAKEFIWNGKLIIKERQVRLKDLFRPNVIKWWIGTDALTLIKYPPGSLTWYIRIFFRRIWYRFVHRYVEHWVVSENIGNEIEQFGIKEYEIVQPNPAHKVVRRKHFGINILYYYPDKKKNKRFNEWVYGKDVFDKVQKHCLGVNWIVLDGNKDIIEAYEIADGVIRPNRHDGMPRMILECQAMGIPYYWSTNFMPQIDEIIEFIETL